MKQINQFSCCPNCENKLQVKVLECRSCGLKLEGPFAQEGGLNLNAEDMRFVRLFIHCEGSIRDMEKALGVSYPTVKARLAQVKARLALESADITDQKGVLDKLADGQIDFNEALKAIKEGKPNA